jgi:hypothetical protein
MQRCVRDGNLGPTALRALWECLHGGAGRHGGLRGWGLRGALRNEPRGL